MIANFRTILHPNLNFYCRLIKIFHLYVREHVKSLVIAINEPCKYAGNYEQNSILLLLMVLNTKAYVYFKAFFLMNRFI